VSLPAAAAPVVIKMGTMAPEGSIWHDALLKIRQEWSEITDGKVELRIYPGGVLGDEAEMVRKVQRRGLDAIAISGAGLPAIDTSVEALNVPLLFESYEELDYVRERIAPRLEARLKKRNFKVLSWAEAGWVHFFAREPVRTPAELRRLRLWIAAGDPDVEQLFKEFGFNVVPLTATDMLTALQTGLIDAVDVPPLFALIDRSYQVADHMTDLKWAPLNAATVISTDAWRRIPSRYQAPLMEAARRIGRELRDSIRQAGDDAVAAMKARGLIVVTLDEAARAAWRDEAAAAWPKLRGKLVEAQLFDEVMRLHTEYRSLHSGPAAGR
jgi:TRAP-type C4-dicarboxylate transport system substrate-binding protein